MADQAVLPPTGGPYSLVRRAPTGLVLVAGQVGVDPASGKMVDGGIQAQTHQAIANIATILASEGMTLRDVLKVSVFLADPDDFDAMNEAYSSGFETPYPVRTTVGAGLGPGALVEIDAIAFDPRGGAGGG
jgi:2-iminobutanoate/2-iminopropanoate deaminase